MQVNRFKELLGYIPTSVINRKLRATTDRSEIARLTKFANDHPNFFDRVSAEVLVPTKFGFSIYCDRRDVIGSSIIEDGQWEALVTETICAILKPGDVALDIGANMGYDALLMSHLVGDKGLVVAFEPDLENLSRFLRSVLVNGRSNIVVQSIALSDDVGKAVISPPPAENLGTSNMRPSGDISGRPILTAKLDSLLNEKDFGRIKLVKMDVEGFEHKVLKGMGGLLDRIDYLTCEINHEFLKECGSSAKEIFDILEPHGFTAYCAGFGEPGPWRKGDYTFAPAKKRAQGIAYDTIFARGRPAELANLIE